MNSNSIILASGRCIDYAAFYISENIKGHLQESCSNAPLLAIMMGAMEHRLSGPYDFELRKFVAAVGVFIGSLETTRKFQNLKRHLPMQKR